MRLKRRTILGMAGTSVALSGCLGGGDGDGDGESTPTDAETEADDDDGAAGGDEDDATVAVREQPDHGEILVGPDGLTLYNFDADTQGEPESACYDDCADSWPPLTVDADPTAGDGVDAELSTFERDDGETQVAANGWPLYYFVADDEPGDANGQGVNDVWWVLRPDGTPLRPDDGEDDADGTGGSNGGDGGDGDGDEESDGGDGERDGDGDEESDGGDGERDGDGNDDGDAEDDDTDEGTDY